MSLWRWVKRTAFLGSSAAVALYGADTYWNDDWDTVYEHYVRKKLDPALIDTRPHVVILGTGWGALSFLRKLRTDEFKVTVVSPRNYFMYTPLLAGTTVGTVEHRSIIEPIRQYCRRTGAANAKYLQAECVDVDPSTNTITCRDSSNVPVNGSKEYKLSYDHLVVAVGAVPATFGIPGVDKYGMFMKELEHAVAIRRRILDNFEVASRPDLEPQEVQRLLHFVIVGGGPAGVEVAAEIHDFLVADMAHSFPTVAGQVRITLVEALPHVLPMFHPDLVKFTEEEFKRGAIDVWNSSQVSEVGEKTFTISKTDGSSSVVPYGALIWVAGINTSPIVNTLRRKISENIQNNRRGLVVDHFFRVKGTHNIWALGDCAFSGFAPTAQVAQQQGRYLGRLFNASSQSMFVDHQDQTQVRKTLPALPAPDKAPLPQSSNPHSPPSTSSPTPATRPQAVRPPTEPSKALDQFLASYTPFSYNHLGSMAYIGDRKAIADFSVDKETKDYSRGNATFYVWRGVYFSRLLSARNRCLVAFDWLKTQIFGRDISKN